MEEKNLLLMASACIHEENLGKNLKYLHLNIISNIDSLYFSFLSRLSLQKQKRNQKKNTV